MNAALGRRAAGQGAGDGGRPARRAVARWAWRLFLREWREQVLMLALLSVAVAATIVGASVASGSASSAQATFGAATHLITLPGSDPQLGADLTAIETAFDVTEAIAHQKMTIPGSVATVDLRAQDPVGPLGHPMLRLVAGRFPTLAGDVAVTDGIAATFNLRIGDVFGQGGGDRRVVGLVENPENLLDEFALVAPSHADPPSSVTVLLVASAQAFQSFHRPRGSEFQVRPLTASGPTVMVLILSTIGLVFVGLVAIASFTVTAQRRLRGLGMLAAVGATHSNIRLVMLANGVLVGGVAAGIGAAVSIAGWIALAPHLEGLVEHRIDRFDLPWWAVGATMLLALVTAIAASWWPARSVARTPIVAALSARPARPRPAHRFAAAGGLLLAAGFVLLALSRQKTPALIVGGIVVYTVGVLLLGPLGIRWLAAIGGRCRIGVRLALRDLGRYQARSGAALAAVSLAVAIAATIAITAAASAAAAAAPSGGNLPANQIIIWLSAHGGLSPVPALNPTELQTREVSANSLAGSLGLRTVRALTAATDPSIPPVPDQGDINGGRLTMQLARKTSDARGTTFSEAVPLYVATPELLARYGIKSTAVDPNADILTSWTDLGAMELIPGRHSDWHPKIQVVDLPTYTSAPTTLITARAMAALGLQALPVGWLVETPQPLTADQVDAARKMAAVSGLSIESRPDQASLALLRALSTAAGILVVLGVLAMTVGLIRSEAAGDLRTLTAAGAKSTTRRMLTAATAGSLALVGALLGTASAYLALAAWYRSNLDSLSVAPVVNLIVIVVGLPLAAACAGWLLAGREPSRISRQPLG
jgi:putative ABC transport system permease protein